MKRLVIVIILAVLPIGLAVLGSSDMDISVADTSILDNEVTSSVSSNSSTTAPITITMYAVDDV